MLFKQLQLFQLTTSIKYTPESVKERLEPYVFNPCLPAMPSSMGWVSPIDVDSAPLVRAINGCIMICLQIEEKILPASVINHTLKDKVKQLELNEGRKIRQKEKLSLKDELVVTLLPRAFTKFTRIYAYLDTRQRWLVLNNASPGKTDIFLSMFKKSFGDTVESINVVKPSALMTHWLKNQDFPNVFAVEKSCVLQDPGQQNRMIRAQEQDLFASSIQSLLKEGCEAIQMGLCWHDRVNFVLAADRFILRSISLAEDDIVEIREEAETKEQKFDADFFMMTETFANMLKDLLASFQKPAETNEARERLAVAV